MKRIICEDFYSKAFSDDFSFDGNEIHVPSRYIKKSRKSIPLQIEDTDGNVLLESTYFAKSTIDEIYRYLPSWGLKLVKNIASVPNVWVVRKVRV
jgi:hypothetical protein